MCMAALSYRSVARFCIDRMVMPAAHTAAKAATAHSMELRMPYEAVAPIYMPAHVKAAHPTGGMSRSHGR